MAPNSSPIDYASMGALTPPPGIIPHFNEPGGQQIQLLAFAIIDITLPTIFVGLRLWTKLRISKDMGWDDCKHMHLSSIWKWVNFVQTPVSRPMYRSIHSFEPT